MSKAIVKKSPVKIVVVPHPVLREMAQEVSVAEAKGVVADLWNALENSKIDGVGIAAPQIGVAKRVFILRKGELGFKAYINPRIVRESEECGPGKDRKGEVFLEGCLSIPGIYGPVIRPLAIEVEYTDETGKLVREELTEPFSRYFQHELDHLNGVLFIDHVMRQGGKLYEVSERDELVEIRLQI